MGPFPHATHLALASLFLSGLCLPAPGAQALVQAQASPPGAYLLDRIVVELDASLPVLEENLDLATAFADDPALRRALSSLGAHAMFRVFRSGGVEARDPALFAALGMQRHYVIELTAGADLTQALAAFEATPSIASVRLDGVVHTTEIPNDPLFQNQWDHLQTNDADMDTQFAWDVSKSNPSVIVAIIDTGCDYGHPEISAALLQGYNFVAGTTNAMDDHGHGTSCAGIAGARSNNGIGIAGVAPLCTILPVKVLNSGGSGSYANVAAGINFAANNGAAVVSMSLAGSA